MNKYLLLTFIFAAIILLLIQRGGEHKEVVVHKISSEQIREIDEKEEKRILEAEKSALDTSSTEAVSDEYDHEKAWEENIKSNLLRQSFDENYDIKLTKESSFTWDELGAPIDVDSVKVSLRNPSGETSSFRALIDKNNGKILRTWDRPVIDPINPREKRGIKLNPLYHPAD